MDWVGTSLGGILTMALAGQCSIRRAVINDIGPVIETRGLDAIRNRVGKAETFATWEDAQAAVIAANARIIRGSWIGLSALEPCASSAMGTLNSITIQPFDSRLRAETSPVLVVL